MSLDPTERMEGCVGGGTTREDPGIPLDSMEGTTWEDPGMSMGSSGQHGRLCMYV